MLLMTGLSMGSTYGTNDLKSEKSPEIIAKRNSKLSGKDETAW